MVLREATVHWAGQALKIKKNKRVMAWHLWRQWRWRTLLVYMLLLPWRSHKNKRNISGEETAAGRRRG